MHLSFKCFMCFMCGMKDSLRSKTTPRNLVSSTTGTGVPFSSREGSGWGLRNLHKCMHTVLEGENLDPLVSAQSASLLQTLFIGLRGGLVVGRRTCELVVAGSRPSRDAAA